MYSVVDLTRKRMFSDKGEQTISITVDFLCTLQVKHTIFKPKPMNYIRQDES